MALDNKELGEFKTKYGLGNHHFWQHKQSNKWIVSHDGVMLAAFKAGIHFEIQPWEGAQDRKSLKVIATMPGRPTVEMIGECTIGKSITKEYPWAMAQKRAEDRATLRLLCPGGGVYSEIESDDFTKPTKPQDLENNGITAYRPGKEGWEETSQKVSETAEDFEL